MKAVANPSHAEIYVRQDLIWKCCLQEVTGGPGPADSFLASSLLRATRLSFTFQSPYGVYGSYINSTFPFLSR